MNNYAAIRNSQRKKVADYRITQLFGYTLVIVSLVASTLWMIINKRFEVPVLPLLLGVFYELISPFLYLRQVESILLSSPRTRHTLCHKFFLAVGGGELLLLKFIDSLIIGSVVYTLFVSILYTSFISWRYIEAYEATQKRRKRFQDALFFHLEKAIPSHRVTLEAQVPFGIIQNLQIALSSADTWCRKFSNIGEVWKTVFVTLVFILSILASSTTRAIF